MHAIDITIAANAGMLFVFDCESGMWDSGEANAHRVRTLVLRYICTCPLRQSHPFLVLGLFLGLFVRYPTLLIILRQ